MANNARMWTSCMGLSRVIGSARHGNIVFPEQTKDGG